MNDLQPHRCKVWVINLDTANNRLESVQSQLEKLELSWVRFPAIRGSALSIAEAKLLLNKPMFILKHGKLPLTGELGCYQSHVAVLRKFLDSDDDCAVIVEDDVTFTGTYPSAVEALLTSPQDWDLVKLSGVHAGTPINIKSITDSVKLAIPLSQFTGASAYLINRKAAQALVRHISVMSLPWDHAFDRNWKYGFKLRMTVPMVCGHGIGDESTINYEDRQKSRLPTWKRLPSMIYRISNELNRFIFRSCEVLLYKLAKRRLIRRNS